MLHAAASHPDLITDLFFRTVLDGIPVEARRAAMVGDDIESDVGGAQAAGLRGILVRTGKYRADAVAASGVTPTATVGSIADVPELLSGVSERRAEL